MFVVLVGSLRMTGRWTVDIVRYGIGEREPACGVGTSMGLNLFLR